MISYRGNRPQQHSEKGVAPSSWGTEIPQYQCTRRAISYTSIAYGHSSQLQQVLANLLLNAIEALAKSPFGNSRMGGAA